MIRGEILRHQVSRTVFSQKLFFILTLLALILPNPSVFSEPVRISPQEKQKIAQAFIEIARIQCKIHLVKWISLLNPKSRYRIIGANPHFVEDSFLSMGLARFADYNAPQVWVESRQIPRLLDGRAPNSAAFVLDLGCGVGDSAKFCSLFAHPQWHIHGLDLSEEFVALAQARAQAAHYQNLQGQKIQTSFYVQNLADPLMLNSERPIPAESVDFAYSSGVVGLYMNPESASLLVKNLFRVIKPGGWIALDSGPAIRSGPLRELVTREGFVYEARVKSIWMDPRPKLIFRKPATDLSKTD